MVRTVKSPEERKLEIMGAAEKLFTKKGIADTSISDIVKSIGVAQGTFYWHFKSKQAVINAIVQSQCFCYSEVMLEIADNDELDAYQKIIAIRDQVFGNVIQGELNDQFHIEDNREFHDSLIKEVTKTMIPILEKVVKQGMKEKIFMVSDANKAALFIFGATNMINEVEVKDQTTLDKYKYAITEFVLRGLGYKKKGV